MSWSSPPGGRDARAQAFGPRAPAHPAERLARRPPQLGVRLPRRRPLDHRRRRPSPAEPPVAPRADQLAGGGRAAAVRPPRPRARPRRARAARARRRPRSAASPPTRRDCGRASQQPRPLELGADLQPLPLRHLLGDQRLRPRRQTALAHARRLALDPRPLPGGQLAHVTAPASSPPATPARGRAATREARRHGRSTGGPFGTLLVDSRPRR